MNAKPLSWLLMLTLSVAAAAGVALGMTAQATLRTPHLFSCFGVDGAQLEQMAQRYDAVIWHNDPLLRQALARLKQWNPQVTGFMYRELFCVQREETPLAETVGSYAWIDAHHPEWFQQDAQGRRVEVPDYPGRWMMDLGHPGWQAFWIEQTLRDVEAGGWDGVFADDVLTSITVHHLPALAGYTTNAALQQAVYGFLAKAHDAFRAKGKLLVANVSGSYHFPGLWERWLAVTDGLMEEHFAGEGWTWGNDVAQQQLQAMRLARQAGKWMFCFTYGQWDDRQRMSTSLAAYLIGIGPRICWSYRPPSDADKLPWDEAWAVSLGDPVGEVEIVDGLWQRRFERGWAVVNVGRRPRVFASTQGPVLIAPQQGVVIEQHYAFGGAGKVMRSQRYTVVAE